MDRFVAIQQRIHGCRPRPSIVGECPNPLCRACDNPWVPDEPGRSVSPRSGGREDTPRNLPGWRVTPAPDGRGGETTPERPPTGRNPRWLVVVVVLALLGLNLWISSQALKPNPRIRIPYSPTFLNQV